MKTVFLFLCLTAAATAATTEFGYNPASHFAYINLGGISVGGGGKHETSRVYYAQSGDTLTSISTSGRLDRAAGNDSLRVALYTMTFIDPGDGIHSLFPADTVASEWYVFTALSTIDTITHTVSIPLTPGTWYSLVTFPSAIDSVAMGRSNTTISAGFGIGGSGTYQSPYVGTGYLTLEFETWGTVTHATTSGTRGKVEFVAERDTIFTTTASNIVLSAPSGLANGDYLLAFAVKGDNVMTEPGFSPPASQGWVKLFQSDNTTSDDVAMMLYGKLIKDAASEPSTYTFSWVVDNEERSGGIIAFRGVDPSNPLDARPSIRFRPDVTGADPSTPSITTRTDSCMIVSIATLSTVINTATLTEPSGFTLAWNRLEATSTHWSSSVAAYALQAAAGASGDLAWTTNSGVAPECFEITVALRPRSNQRGQVH